MYINLLPREEKKLLRRRYYARVFLVGAVLFAVLMVFSTLGLLPAIIHLEYAEIRSVGQMPAIATSTAALQAMTISEVNNAVQAVNNKISIVNGTTPIATLSKQTEIIMLLIGALDRAVKSSGAKATFTTFHFVRNIGDMANQTPPNYSVTISGVAEDRATLLALTKELTKTDGIKSVNNPISNYVPGKNLSFTITITVL